MKTMNKKILISRLPSRALSAIAVVAVLMALAPDTAVAQRQRQQQEEFQQNGGDRNTERGSRRDRTGGNFGGNFGGGFGGNNGGGGGNSNFSFGRNQRGGGRSDRGSRTSSDDPFIQQYGMLSEYNIFLRPPDRGPRPERPTPPPQIPLEPEQTFVLTGVVFEEDLGMYRAYIEDVNRGTVLKLNVGDTVARGKVGEILLDAIYYDREGVQTWVDVGSYLTGAPVGSISQARVNAAFNRSGWVGWGQGQQNPGSGQDGTRGGGTLAAPPSSFNLNDPSLANLSIEERLRLRRLQESNPNAAGLIPGAIPSAGQQQPQQEQQQQGDGDDADQMTNDADQQQQPTPAAGGGTVVDPGTANLSMEEQLRLRRMQEIGR
jgi:hypothetical protein